MVATGHKSAWHRLALPQVPELAGSEDCRDTVSQLQDAALVLRSGGVQLLQELRTCRDPDWIGLER